MFRKKNDCWKEPYKDNEWEYFNLGDPLSSFVNTSPRLKDARLGFSGDIRVE